MMRDHLDIEYPQGNPNAIICRECATTRVFVGETLFCKTCDGGGYTTALASRFRN